MNKESLIGKELISWEITPDEVRERQKQAKPIIMIPVMGGSLSLFFTIYFGFHTIFWASVVSVGLFAFFIWTYYIYKPKRTFKYILGENGVFTKSRKEKFYSWQKLRGYQSQMQSLRKISMSQSSIKNLESSIGKVFNLRQKNPFLDWGQVLILAESDNSSEVERILAKKLKRLSLNEKPRFLQIVIIVALTTLASIIYNLLKRGTILHR